MHDLDDGEEDQQRQGVQDEDDDDDILLTKISPARTIAKFGLHKKNQSNTLSPLTDNTETEKLIAKIRWITGLPEEEDLAIDLYPENPPEPARLEIEFPNDYTDSYNSHTTYGDILKLYLEKNKLITDSDYKEDTDDVSLVSKITDWENIQRVCEHLELSADELLKEQLIRDEHLEKESCCGLGCAPS